MLQLQSVVITEREREVLWTDTEMCDVSLCVWWGRWHVCACMCVSAALASDNTLQINCVKKDGTLVAKHTAGNVSTQLRPLVV